MILDILFCILFVLGLFYFGMRKSQAISSESEYLIANRDASLLALTATLVMTEFNTATLISFSSFGYLAGGWALWLPCVFLVGLLFYAFTVAKKWKAFNGLSVASFFTQRYGRDIGILASVALLLAMAGFSAAYVKSFYIVFTPVFPALNQWVLSTVLVAFVLLMMLRGGLLAIIRTDLFSFFAVALFFPLLALFCYKTPIGEASEVVNATMTLPPRLIISFIILTMFTYILAPWYGQKIFAARSQKTAYLAVIFAAIFIFIFYGLAVMSTWFFRNNGGIVPSAEQALPFAIAQVLPKGLRGLGYGILFAASATTLTGVWSAMTSLVVGDFSKLTENYQRSMFLTLGFALISLILANVLVDRVFDKLVLANIPIAALSFALLGGFYWKRASRVGAYASMIVGWFCAIYAYLQYGEAGIYTWYWAIWGIPATFLTGVIGSILAPNKEIISSNYQ